MTRAPKRKSTHYGGDSCPGGHADLVRRETAVAVRDRIAERLAREVPGTPEWRHYLCAFVSALDVDELLRTP